MCAISLHQDQNFAGKPYEDNLHEIIWNLSQEFRRCGVKICPLLPLVANCLAVWNNLGNFGRGHYEEHLGHYEEHLCEIILNLDKQFRRC